MRTPLQPRSKFFTLDGNVGVAVLPEHGEDVTGAGSIFASIDASTKLTQRLQDVQVVAAHKILGQVDDGHHESLLQTDGGRKPEGP